MDEIAEIVAKFGPSMLSDVLSANALPAVAFALVAPTASRSRFGGAPRLPPGFTWPHHVPPPDRLGLSKPESPSTTQPLDFLIQIDLSEVQGLEPTIALPERGLLTFFYDVQHQPWGFDPADRSGFSVVLVDSDGALETALPRPSPLRTRGVRFWNAMTFPHVGSHAYDALDAIVSLPDEYWDLACELERRSYPLHGGLHRLGGHSANIQGDMQLEAQLVSNGLFCGDQSGRSDREMARLEAGAKDWVLLLQLDSDEAAGMLWGDTGMLYFWIRRDDLAAGRFDRCWAILQCG